MCYEWHIGCSSSVDPVKYDPVAAKKLLTEAGYPNGFDLALTPGGRRDASRKRSLVSCEKSASTRKWMLTLGIFVQKRADGKIQTQISLWDNGVAQPDVESTMGFFFQPSSRDRLATQSWPKRSTMASRARSEKAGGDIPRSVRPSDRGTLRDAPGAECGDCRARQEPQAARRTQKPGRL